METGQVSADQAGSMRELARLALSDHWSIEAGMATGEDAAAACRAYADSLLPLAETDPELTGKAAIDARTWLKPIGMKIAPTMSADQCSAWLNAVMLALSDFPARVVMQAARIAIRTPMEFLNQVDGHVRAEAEKIMRRHRVAMVRLERLSVAIERANEPALPAPEGYEAGDVPPMSIADIKATATAPGGAGLLRIGLAQGFIEQADYDRAMRELSADSEINAPA